MLKGRGKMKRTRFMLPEHVEGLKRVWEEDEKVSKPMLDQQEIETINRQLIEASKTKSLVKLTVYENGSINEYEGTIRALSSQTNTDRKSTRLNSSHVSISYAVYCLK